MDFAVLADHRIKLKESDKKDKYLHLARELKKPESDGVLIVIGIRTGELGNKRMARDHPNYSIIAIGQILRRVLET